MHLSTVPYYFATCSGKVDNLLNPRCQNMGPGSFDEQEATTKAKDEGWVEAANGKPYCKTHAGAAGSGAGEETTASRRRGRTKEQPAAGSDAPAPAEWSS